MASRNDYFGLTGFFGGTITITPHFGHAYRVQYFPASRTVMWVSQSGQSRCGTAIRCESSLTTKRILVGRMRCKAEPSFSSKSGAACDRPTRAGDGDNALRDYRGATGLFGGTVTSVPHFEQT